MSDYRTSARVSLRVALRYLLFQIPGWIAVTLLALWLREPLGMAWWMAWTLIGAWVAKDFALFPLVWRAYLPQQPDNAHSLLGQRGVADEPLAPSGYVRVRGELWRAEAPDANRPIPRGAPVRVIGARGISLHVVEETPE